MKEPTNEHNMSPLKQLSFWLFFVSVFVSLSESILPL